MSFSQIEKFTSIRAFLMLFSYLLVYDLTSIALTDKGLVDFCAFNCSSESFSFNPTVIVFSIAIFSFLYSYMLWLPFFIVRMAFSMVARTEQVRSEAGWHKLASLERYALKTENQFCLDLCNQSKQDQREKDEIALFLFGSGSITVLEALFYKEKTLMNFIINIAPDSHFDTAQLVVYLIFSTSLLFGLFWSIQPNDEPLVHYPAIDKINGFGEIEK